MCKNRVLTSQTVSDKGKLWDTNARVSEQEFKTNRIFFSASQRLRPLCPQPVLCLHLLQKLYEFLVARLLRIADILRVRLGSLQRMVEYAYKVILLVCRAGLMFTCCHAILHRS